MFVIVNDHWDGGWWDLFAGGNTGLTFAALAIADAEVLYPGAIINIKEVTLDGTAVPFKNYYTSSDDGSTLLVGTKNITIKFELIIP